MTGLAAVRCKVTPNGRPSACVIESETPSGYGFGQAAIRTVMRARLDPASIRPEDVDTTFVVTVPFGR